MYVYMCVYINIYIHVCIYITIYMCIYMYSCAASVFVRERQTKSKRETVCRNT